MDVDLPHLQAHTAYLQAEGEAFPIGEERHVTDVSIMKEYIQSEILKSIPAEELNDE